MTEKNEENSKKDQDSSNKDTKKKKSKKMKKNTIKKIATVVILIAILAVILYFAFKTLKPEQTIATVNDETITNLELDQKYDQLPDQYKLFITKDAFLDQIINVKLLLQEAKKQSITVSEIEIESEVNTLKEQAPTEEAFEDLLKQQNINLEELKEQLNEQLMINKLLNTTVISKIEISESKIRNYYKTNGEYFQENDISYIESKEQIKQILLSDISSTAIEIYINQLRSNAVVTKKGEKTTTETTTEKKTTETTTEKTTTETTTEIGTFTETNDAICKKDGKVVVRLFSTTKNSASNWVSKTFDEIAAQYGEDIIAYHWQLDTGDNTLTNTIEKGIPKEEVSIFQKYNNKNTVPTYVFGCKYTRIGNAYDSLEDEGAEFKKVIENLLVV